MALAIGSRLGPYEVLGSLGAGGMGEVYRARDTKLGRDVAIKVLPASLTSDPERLARFSREAQILASLNHPNIAGIHHVEETTDGPAIVMELVEGETLADRIAQGPIPVDETLAIARQIAEALEAAHEQGIIHRDLKPANIKLRPDGTVKVLDFGLAKLAETSSSRTSDISLSPTITSPAMMTGVGVLLGTAAYMSPEQAKGKPADKRSDIWAFGCVLYEMLTGRRVFDAEDVTETLAFVLTRVPDWTVLPAGTPPSIARLLHRTLARNPRERLSDMSAARLDIDEALSAASNAPAPIAAGTHPLRNRRVAAAFVAVILAGLVSTTIVWTLSSPQPSPLLTLRFTLSPPEGWTVAMETGGTGAANLPVAISPDGRHIVMVARDAGRHSRLWVRSLDSLAARELVSTDDAVSPFWSPDSRFVAFFANGKLKKVDISGGLPVTLCTTESLNSGSWSRSGTIVFARAGNAGGGALLKVSQSGGVPAAATTLGTGEALHIRPVFLPDGRRFLYVATTLGGERTVYVGSLDSSDRHRVLNQQVGNVAVANGNLLFLQESTLLAQRFDVASGLLRGEPVPIADQLQVSGNDVPVGDFSVSETGILVYQTGEGAMGSTLTWLDRSGKALGTVGSRARYTDIELSPDGLRATASVARREPARDVWLFDVVRNAATRFTFLPAGANSSVWSPDGKYIVFSGTRSGRGDLFRKAADGTGPDQPVLVDMRNKVPWSWSPDGKFIAYSALAISGSGGPSQLWILPLSGVGKPYQLFDTQYATSMARFSPDGRWLAYVSNESGQGQVYVVSFPSLTGKWQVSIDGGTQPRWRRDGKELFFLSGGMLVAASVDGASSSFKIGAVQRLFQTRTSGGPRSVYDVAPDGQRFLVETRGEETTTSPITVVVNWPASLNDR